MNKKFIKMAASLALVAVVGSCIPETVYASSDFVFPSAGGALAAGMGTSMRDIRANIARNAAKQSAVSNHSAVSKVDNSSSEQTAVEEAESKVTSSAQIASTDDSPKLTLVEDEVKDTKKTDANENPETDSVNESDDSKSDQSSKSAPASTKEETMQDANKSVSKVETPSSKAVNESTVINGVSVVGSASEGAKIEVSATEEEVKDENAMPSLEDVNKTEEKKEEEVKPENISDASIDVLPEAMDVEEGEEDLSRSVIAQVDVYVNVRESASEESEVVGKLYNHSAGTWIGKEGDWYKIKSGSVTGYVKGEFVVTGQAAVKLAAEVGERVAVVNTTTLKIREEANTESAVLGLVPMEDRLTVLEEKDDWVKVSIEEGDGWVSREFVSVSTEFPKAESKAEEEARLRKEEEERKRANAAAAKAAKKNKGSKGKSGGGAVYYSSGGSGAGSSVANYALQFVGNPYVYGGTSLTNGTDCSGFTMGVYRNFGVSLPHSSGAQRSCGYAVGSIAEAQPGDLICYSGHVALYIGGGQIVHASTAKTGIKVSNASYRNILAIRRIF